MMGWMMDVEMDREKLVELFKQSADSGYSRAQYTMGMLHMTGEVVEQNIETAYWWLKSAAAQNHPLALHHIGICYAQGIVVEPDIEQAFNYFSRSADLGLDAAKNSLAVFYNNGIHVIQNEWKASELYLEAADEGDQTAAYNIGNCYLEGKGVKRDVGKGLEWIARSAEQGNLIACSQMSRIYEEGLLVDHDAVELAYWREKAAELGSRLSMKQTAMNYFYGKGIPKNRGKAAFWISQYINSNGLSDTNSLLLEGEYENFADVQKLLPQDYSALIVYADLMTDADWSGYDPKEAYRILYDLAGRGFNGARFRLAKLHVDGGFAKASSKKAYSLYKSLFDENRDSDLEVEKSLAGKAAYYLSGCLAEGIGVRASEIKAFKWLEESAYYGYAQAQYELGKRIVFENDPVKLSEGVYWLMEAANQGHHDSHVALAKLNLETPIPSLDQETIIVWLKDLVDSGSGEARTLLKRYGVEYKVPVSKPRAPRDDEEKKINPYAPIEAA
jgi:TPR repeat protein